MADGEVDPESGVVVGEVAHEHAVRVDTGIVALVVSPQPGRGGDVNGIGDRLMASPAALVGGDQSALTTGAHGVQIGVQVDHPPDHRWVDRVVVAQHPQVVIPRQPGMSGEPNDRRHRR